VAVVAAVQFQLQQLDQQAAGDFSDVTAALAGGKVDLLLLGETINESAPWASVADMTLRFSPGTNYNLGDHQVTIGGGFRLALVGDGRTGTLTLAQTDALPSFTGDTTTAILFQGLLIDNNNTHASNAYISGNGSCVMVLDCRVEFPNEDRCGWNTEDGPEGTCRYEGNHFVGGGSLCSRIITTSSAYGTVVEGNVFDGSWKATTTYVVAIAEGYMNNCTHIASTVLRVSISEPGSMINCGSDGSGSGWYINAGGHSLIQNVSSSNSGHCEIGSPRVKVSQCEFLTLDLNTVKQTVLEDCEIGTISGLGNDFVQLRGCHILNNLTLTGDYVTVRDCKFVDITLATKRTLTLDSSSVNCDVSNLYGIYDDQGTGNTDNLSAMSEITSLASITWVHVWPFSENTGTTVADSITTNDGTLVNGPVWISGPKKGGTGVGGKHGISCQIGSTEHMSTALLGTVGAGDFTMFAWFRLKTGTITGHVFGLCNPASAQIWNVNYNTGQSIPALVVQTTDSLSPVNDREQDIFGNEWNLAHVTRDQSTGVVQVFINGQLSYAEASSFDTSDYSSLDFYLHKRDTSGADQNGAGASYSEAGITASLMNAAQIKTHWNYGKGYFHG